MGMEFSCKARLLKESLDAARHAVPASPALAVFGGVQIEASASRVTVTGSDGETTISSAMDASVSSEGAVVLPHKPISTFLATIDASADVRVVLSDGEVVLHAASLSPYRFRTTGTRFPSVLSPKGKPKKADFSRLAAALSVVRAAVGGDHNGVQVLSDSAGLHLRTTDHYRLHAVTLPEASFGEFSGVLPLNVLDRVAAHTPTEVTPDDRGKSIQFSSPSVSITSRLLQVPFPNASAVLEQSFPGKAVLDVEQARQSLSRLGAVAADRTSGSDGTAVTVTGDAEGIRFEVSNANVGSGAEILDGESSELRFVVDRQFLLAALLAHQADSVVIGYAGPHAPVLISSSKPLQSATVVMPMRI